MTYSYANARIARLENRIALLESKTQSKVTPMNEIWADTIENNRVSETSIKCQDSSFIESVAYNTGSRDLFVNMKNGRAYVYVGVPQFIFNGFRSKNNSVGSFFNREIKGQFAVHVLFNS